MRSMMQSVSGSAICRSRPPGCCRLNDCSSRNGKISRRSRWRNGRQYPLSEPHCSPWSRAAIAAPSPQQGAGPSRPGRFWE
jgi:hypothetical protein